MNRFGTHLAIRDATDAETKKAIADHDAVVIEWSTGVSFIASFKELVLVRTGGLGGDVRQIHWAWKYLTPIHLQKEVGELLAVARGMRRTGLN